MPAIKEQPIFLKGNNGTTSPATFYTIEYDQRDRLKRALKVLLICWLLAPALFFTFVPVVHLVLSVGVFLAGPLLAYRRYRMLSSNDKVSGQCPQCRNAITLRLEPAEKLAKWKYCPRCQAPLQILEQP